MKPETLEFDNKQSLALRRAGLKGRGPGAIFTGGPI